MEKLPNSFPEIHVKKEFFDMIVSGTKTSELRIAFQSFKSIEVGNIITFKDGSGNSVNVEIKKVQTFKTLEEVLNQTDLNQLVPGISIDQAKQIAQSLFRQADIDSYGLILIEFKKIER